jgi:LDH2 family malate/lactate/ureidoglycolate dehydrogenase
MPIIFSSDLIGFVERILVATQVPPDIAELVAHSLVAANLRGVDSHGAQLLPFSIEQLTSGDMDPAARGRVVSEIGSCLVYDGENGIGQWVAETCCNHVIRIADACGIGMAVVRESNHFGAAAWWGQKISATGKIGIVMCNASSLVPPWQGKKPRLGTNPICVSVPGPWLLDMATTTVAAGKIYKAMINGQDTIPPGWAMDAEGVPTTNTQAALKGLLMPLGGYKGSGLAMMAEILCSVLGGGALCNEVGGIRIRGRKLRVSQMFLAIDIGRFMPVETFTARVEKLVEIMKTTPPAPGYEEVLVAGDPEWRTDAERRKNGIPVGEGTWEALVAAANRLGVTVPQVEQKADR